MKKVWLAIYVLMLGTLAVRAEYSDALPEDRWVDSVYQQLTLAEKVGQLIDLRIAPTSENITELVELIENYHVGAITIMGGDARATVRLVRRLHGSDLVPIYVTSENAQSLALPFHKAMSLPSAEVYNRANDPQLLQNTLDVLAGIYADFGIQSHSFNPLHFSFSESGFNKEVEFNGEYNLLNTLPEQYKKHDLVISTEMHFEFEEDFAFSPKNLDNWNNTEWKDKIQAADQDWNRFNLPKSVITIKSIPDFPESEASHFYKKVINPLFWKHLQFSGLLSIDLNSILANSTQRHDPSTIRKMMKIGADKLVTSADVKMVHTSLIDAVERNDIRKNDIREKVKRNLRLKYQVGLKDISHTLIYDDQITFRLNDPELVKNNFLVYQKASELKTDREGSLPVVDVENTSFASLSLGFNESKAFQETLEKYAPFVHYIMPDASFNPYDLDIIFRQLKQFDHVIIALHTSDLMSYNQEIIDFLIQLKSYGAVTLVYFGNEVNAAELIDFPNKLLMFEDNEHTQRIAAARIFGAYEKARGRLAYSTPEIEGMDSRTLAKVDAIIHEAISKGATPGCQLLVARNGAVILEKGYGHYTYDSIMEVDTRTLYDLASITKVAATTQAVMKLNEDGIISLDSTLGAYLPELKETNKEHLIVKDVLTHQSGLRAFYPFWYFTMGDGENTIEYYKRYPDPSYQNTVAYGMFAANDLKDSLWHWTIDTKLRRKKYDFEPYDYRYSDLGFYLLQMLTERTSGIELDAYMDSLFYKPIGMGTMTYNPLCKFQLKRITPTERDRHFRHVLVWGTVHDQIAAMKGGVSGHAGLFSNAHDVAKIMQLQLQGGMYGGKQLLNNKTIQHYTSYQSEESRRGLGWDKPEKREDEFSPVSRYASHESFGHTGFTGTIAWADPTFDLVFVFLSNRIYPDMSNKKLNQYNIRTRLQDVVYESIWNFQKTHN